MEIVLILIAAAVVGFVIYKVVNRKPAKEAIVFPTPSAPYEPTENVWHAPAAVTTSSVVNAVVVEEATTVAAAEVAPVATVAEVAPKAKTKKVAAPKAKKAPAKAKVSKTSIK